MASAPPSSMAAAIWVDLLRVPLVRPGVWPLTPGQELALAVARRGATMRIMTAERPAGVILLDDMADYPRHSGKFMLKLLLAWMAMGFR